MRRETRDGILMTITAVAFVLDALLLNNFLVEISPAVEELILLGWVVLGIGALLVILSVVTLHRKGISNLIDSGVYGVVRHPMYVGGMVMFFSYILFGQDWIIAACTCVALVCCYLLMRSEDEQLVEKFAGEYTEYMRKVPMMNFVIGTVRAVSRRSKG
jgi:protein-S-isoprenylcysteine O-methyltransferase Ste14